MDHSKVMKPLEINPTTVSAVSGLVPEPARIPPVNPLSDSPAAAAFDEFSTALADRIYECATRIADHAGEVAAFTEIAAQADEANAAGLKRIRSEVR